jgi:predicted AAA+ superfamily ATPase
MDTLSLLQTLLAEFWQKLHSIGEIVPRDICFPNAPNKILVAIGVRRTGKTYLLYQKILTLLQEGVDPTAVLYLDFEDPRLLPLDQKKFAALVDGFYTLHPQNHDRKCYLFLDHLEQVEGWPLVVRRLHDTKQAQIFLAGCHVTQCKGQY